jgi:hypothetical protein
VTTTEATTTAAEETKAPAPYEISLQILNGTFTIGLAKSWQTQFETAGFKAITIGNAEKRDYKAVEITYKPSKKDALASIKETLEKGGGIIGEEKEGSEEQTFDVVIIIGQLD